MASPSRDSLTKKMFGAKTKAQAAVLLEWGRPTATSVCWGEQTGGASSTTGGSEQIGGDSARGPCAARPPRLFRDGAPCRRTRQRRPPSSRRHSGGRTSSRRKTVREQRARAQQQRTRAASMILGLSSPPRFHNFLRVDNNIEV